jgi:hypothetical protein
MYVADDGKLTSTSGAVTQSVVNVTIHSETVFVLRTRRGM